MIKFPHDFERFTFPDGMSHIKLKEFNDSDIAIQVFNPCKIFARITSPTDLFDFCSFIDIARSHNVREIYADFVYLMGQRMDRAISPYQPMTMRVVANIINSLKLDGISILSPHSSSVLDMLNGGMAKSLHSVEYHFYKNAIRKTKEESNHTCIGIVLPDDGAAKRWHNNFSALNSMGYVVECSKHRDMSTGKLSGFRVNSDHVPDTCVIIDDLIDGGGTFVGLAAELKKQGAKTVNLAVVHGIFSKGYNLANISTIFTTNSYQDFDLNVPYHFNVTRVI